MTAASVARDAAGPIAARPASTRDARRAVPLDIDSWLLDLPPLPHVVAEVTRALHDEHLSLDHCRAVIESDPALAMRLVRAANAPLYGQSGRVTGVVQALQLMGLRTVVGLMLTVAMHDWAQACPRAISTLSHMSAVASLARSVADRAGVARDEAFLAGLLHDTGLVLLQIRPDAAGHADDVHEPADRLHHSEIGSAALRAWGLPETLNDAIARHHEPAWLGAGAPRSLTAVIAVADALACIAARPVRAQAPAPAQAPGRQEDVASASNVADVAPGSRVDAEWPAWVADDIPALLEVAREAVGHRGDQPGSPVR